MHLSYFCSQDEPVMDPTVAKIRSRKEELGSSWPRGDDIEKDCILYDVGLMYVLFEEAPLLG